MPRIKLYEPYGYIEELDYKSRKSKLDSELEKSKENDEKEFSGLTILFDKSFTSVEYDSGTTQLVFKNISGDTRGVAELSDLISSDFITEAHYDSETKELVITFKNGQEARIPLDDLIDINEFGDGLEVVDGTVKIKIDENGESFLSISEDGLKIDGVQDAINAATSGFVTDLAERLEEEIERATSKENELEDLIQSEVSSRTESEDAINARIDDEISRATEKENELEDKISQVESGLSEEISARETADNEINNRIDEVESLVNTLSGSVEEEVSRATSAETALDEKITDETSRATSEEERIEGKLDDEITRSVDTDEYLEDLIGQVSGSVSAIQETISEIDEYVGDGKTIEVREIDGENKKEISATISMLKITSGLEANIQEAYQLVDSEGTKIGDQINIYKDSSLLGVALVGSPASWDPINREIVGGSGETVLAFAYELADASEVVVTEIPISQLVSEAQFKDGLQVNDNNEVSVKVDPTSEEFLSVSEDGVKVHGVKDAIEEAVEEATSNAISGVSVNGKHVSILNKNASFTISASEIPFSGTPNAIVIQTDENGNIVIGLGIVDSGSY